MKMKARIAPDGMNQTEKKYAEYLSILQAQGDIISFKFEPLKLMLARNSKGGKNAVTYSPDFMVVHKSGVVTFVDVKFKRSYTQIKNGKKTKKNWTSMTEDARVKINVAAELFPEFNFICAYWNGSLWVEEQVS